MTLIDDTCDKCGYVYDPMGDPLLYRKEDLGAYHVWCWSCEMTQRNADNDYAVCMTHGKFPPCRREGGCCLSHRPMDILAVTEYQQGLREDWL